MFQVRSKNMPVAMFSSESAGERLSTVIGVVTDCCHLALEIPDLAELCGQLNGYPEEQRGFAYEGAGVGLATDTTSRRQCVQVSLRHLFGGWHGDGPGLSPTA